MAPHTTVEPTDSCRLRKLSEKASRSEILRTDVDRARKLTEFSF
jgi:hypothetical protein